MKIAQFNLLFEKIDRLVIQARDNEESRLEAIEQLNIMGEELLKAEESMDKFRALVKNIKKELEEALAQTGAPIGNETPKALENSLKAYKSKWNEMQRERAALRREYENIDEQLKLWKAGGIPEKMRPNLESLAREQPSKQMRGPEDPRFYKYK